MKLAEIIDTFISGEWGNEIPSEDMPNAVFCVRGADIIPISNNEYVNIPQRFISYKALKIKKLQAGDLVIEKSGGSPQQSTGRIIYISNKLIQAKNNIVCSNFCTAIRVKSSWNSKYIYYLWQNIYNSGVFFNYEGKTSGIKNLQLENALTSIEINNISIEKQNKIVKILSNIDKKISINQQINQNLPSLDHSSKVVVIRLAA